jgi:putative Mg2+ transporter-C (MgtC) family protein
MQHLPGIFSSPELLADGLSILNIFGAMLLGIVMGYERSFHGHAAGMRTYGVVCMASAALTVIGGYPGAWFGGVNAAHAPLVADPSRIIQGIVTGIGFLGAGVIMKEGFTIRGLSTAASIWATSVIGMIMGVGFYATATVTTILVLIVMGSFKKLELRLPHRRQIRVSLVYRRDSMRPAEEMPELLRQFGYTILEMACQSDQAEKHFEYDLVLQGDGTHNFNQLVDVLRKHEDLVQFRLSPVRD